MTRAWEHMGGHKKTRDVEVTVQPSHLSDGAGEVDYPGQCGIF